MSIWRKFSLARQNQRLINQVSDYLERHQEVLLEKSKPEKKEFLKWNPNITVLENVRLQGVGSLSEGKYLLSFRYINIIVSTIDEKYFSSLSL